MFSTLTTRVLAILTLASDVSACMLATFTYDPCTRDISGSLWDNAVNIGGISPGQGWNDGFGTLINLRQEYISAKINAYIHEVRGANVEGGYLSHITMWDWSSGAAKQLHSFELVLDRNGQFSMAVFGCDDAIVADKWFYSPPHFGWSRWHTHHPTSTHEVVMCKPADADAPPTPTTIWYDGKPVDTEIALAPGNKRRAAGFETRVRREEVGAVETEAPTGFARPQPMGFSMGEAQAADVQATPSLGEMENENGVGKMERRVAQTTSW